jgi:hypothetical protein
MKSLIVLFLTTVGAAGSANAITFIVDTTSDANLSTCDSNVANDCSLRGAMTAANLTSAEDRIEFAIPMNDAGFQAPTQHWRIGVGDTPLPRIEAPVVIDGYTQTGAVPNTNTPAQGGLNGTLKIEIVPTSTFGAQQPALDTFSNNFSAPASTIRGLVISRFFAQIQLAGSGAHRVEGCYLGTDITGTAAAVTTNSGRGNGIVIQQGPAAYQIGGVLPAQRNLLSGMFSAITQQRDIDGLIIRGNLIGTNAAGTAAIPNTNDALNFGGGQLLRNTQIGGTDTNARNVIAASHFSAIRMFGQGTDPFAGSRIEGNFIGTDWSGTLPLGNGINPLSPSQVQPSIQIGGLIACNLTIGGAAVGQANLIAHSGGVGVLNDSCRGVQAADNRYFANRGIALDNAQGGLGPGPTPNDPNDADEGLGNRGQNYPELALGNPNPALVQYRVDTAVANATYPITVNFYRAGCGGGGAQRVASATITAAQAQQLLTVDLSTVSFLPLTATAVDAAGNTSEFAPALGDMIFRSDFEDVLGVATLGSCR